MPNDACTVSNWSASTPERPALKSRHSLTPIPEIQLLGRFPPVVACRDAQCVPFAVVYHLKSFRRPVSRRLSRDRLTTLACDVIFLAPEVDMAQETHLPQPPRPTPEPEPPPHQEPKWIHVLRHGLGIVERE